MHSAFWQKTPGVISLRYLFRLFLFARPYGKYLGVATFSILAVTGMNLVMPLIVKELIGLITNMAQGTAASATNRIPQLGMILFAAYALRAFFQYFARQWTHIAGWYVVRDMRSQVYNHLQRLSLRFYHERQTGELMSRTINDTGNFEVLIAHAIPDTFTALVMLIGVAAILFNMNARLALLVLLPIPPMVWLVVTFARKVRPAFRQQQERLAELNSALQDNFSGIKEIQAFTQEKHESSHIAGKAADHAMATIRSVKLGALYHPCIEMLTGFGQVIVVWLGGLLAYRHAVPPQELVAFILYLNMFYGPVQTLSRVNEDLQNAMASAERVFHLLEQEPDVHEPTQPITLHRVQGRVTFNDVSFAYSSKTQVLNHINLDVQPGETIAIVGPTGVGKSTLVSLIPRFYDPTSGTVCIDGTDIRAVSLASLRSQISLVLQDVFLFNGTVLDNILYGRPNANRREVVAAAKAACAHEFISCLPDGYETHIGERGVKLSGGQKQRLSIARAILRDSPILILDEATSSVDTYTEKLIQEALANVSRNRTTFVIAHRLSTVQQADRIIVLSEGEIAECGTHTELLQAGGMYAGLCAVRFAEEDQPVLPGGA